MKLVYNGYLYEARNIPTEEQLIEKYSKLGDEYFFSYRDRKHIGLNPQSKWKTPNGLYTYNFQDIKNSNIPYKGPTNSGYLYVIKIKEGVNGIDSETYTNDDFNKDLIKLDSKFKGLVDYNENSDGDLLPIKKIWKATYGLKGNSNEWTLLLLSLGYSYIRDRGTGTIHTNEPIQTVFLSPKAYEVVEYGTYGNVHEFAGTVDSKWSKKYESSIRENQIKSVSNYIVKQYKLDGTLPTKLTSTNTDISTKIYKRVFDILGQDVLEDMIRNDAEFFTINISSEYTKELINTYKDIIINNDSFYFLRKLNDEDRYSMVLRLPELFKKTKNIEWISMIGKNDRPNAVLEFKDNVNNALELDPSIPSELAYWLKPLPVEYEDRIIKALKYGLEVCIKRGQFNWMESFFYNNPSTQLDRIETILTTTLKEATSYAIKNDNAFELLSFFMYRGRASDVKAINVLKRLYNFFKDEFDPALKNPDTLGPIYSGYYKELNKIINQ